MGMGLRFGLGPLRFYVPVTGGKRKKRRRKTTAKHYTHGTCTIHHRTPEAASRCKGTR
jgi:hypothetical protein